MSITSKETRAEIAGIIINPGRLSSGTDTLVEFPYPRKRMITPSPIAVRPHLLAEALTSNSYTSLVGHLQRVADEFSASIPKQNLVLVGINDPRLHEKYRLSKVEVPSIEYAKRRGSQVVLKESSLDAFNYLPKDRELEVLIMSNEFTNGSTEAQVVEQMEKSGLQIGHTRILTIFDYELTLSRILIGLNNIEVEALCTITDVLTHPTFMRKFGTPTFAARLQDIKEWYQGNTVNGRTEQLPF